MYQLNLGILQAMNGALGAGLSAFDAAATTFTEMGNSRGRALVLSNSAWTRYGMLGEDARATEDLEDALSYLEAR